MTFAQPKHIHNIQDCYFYHTMDIPGHGLVHGDWDLRQGAQDYLGGVDVRGKRVLDVGAASGFLSFYLEQHGADVVSYDLSPEQAWDVVPYAGFDHQAWLHERQGHLEQIDNAYWLSHQALGSSAHKMYGTVYDVPPAIGPVDIAVFGSILLHLRDPFRALQAALGLVTDTVVVTDFMPLRGYLYLLDQLPLPGGLSFPSLRYSMKFLPNARKRAPVDAWWSLTPDLVKGFLAVLGFEDAVVTIHAQPYRGRKGRLFTVVGKRTRQNV